MSIIDELKKLSKPYDDPEENLGEDEIVDEGEDLGGTNPFARPQDPGYGPTTQTAAPGYGGGDIPRPGTAAPVPPVTPAAPAEDSKYRVILVKPEEFSAATPIAKHICQGDTVILNCEDTNEQTARRVIDFLSGCAFALDGSIKKAASNVIIIAPKEVGVNDADYSPEEPAEE